MLPLNRGRALSRTGKRVQSARCGIVRPRHREAAVEHQVNSFFLVEGVRCQRTMSARRTA